MNNELLTKHERRGYAKGYAAGMRRKQHEVDAAVKELQNDKQATYERVYLSVLNGLISTTDKWKLGEKPASSVSDYCSIARSFTREATKNL